MTVHFDAESRTAAVAPDVATFEALLAPVLTTAYDLAYAMLRDRQEAEDAVQEAALKAWRHFDRFEDRGGGVRPWFLTIVANHCRSMMRTHWWQSRPRTTELPDMAGGGHESSSVLRMDLRRAMARLTPEQRAALFLCYELDLPQEEAARVLHVRTGTIKSRLARAARKLRESVGEL
jgi:RNA polymerase sigma-70 factor (ECF subfamily)